MLKNSVYIMPDNHGKRGEFRSLDVAERDMPIGYRASLVAAWTVSATIAIYVAYSVLHGLWHALEVVKILK